MIGRERPEADRDDCKDSRLGNKHSGRIPTDSFTLMWSKLHCENGSSHSIFNSEQVLRPASLFFGFKHTSKKNNKHYLSTYHCE
ncbi:hypothetical protein M2426_001246 [Pseudomonas moraviensis]